MSRIRANQITNQSADGAPTVQNGLVISGVTTSTNVSVASSVTATTYYGSGANLTGLSGVSVVNQANNRLITATGTTDALNGEAQLTFDGNKLITQQTNSDIGLLVQNTTHDSQLRIEAQAANKNSTIMFADGTDGDVGMIDYDHNDNSLSFTVNTSERLRIDSSGRLLLGTTTAGHVDLDDLTISTSGNTGITIRSGTSSLGVIGFADGTSGNTQYRGVIQYRHSNDAMEFNTGDAQRMRILGDGRVLINTSDGAAFSSRKLSVADTSSGATTAIEIRLSLIHISEPTRRM